MSLGGEDDSLADLLGALANAPEVNPSLAVGTRLGSIELLEKIGAGGTSQVYRGHDADAQRDVAVKLLSAARLDKDAVSRLEREARVLGSLDHPNIVRVFGSGKHHETPYLVLELLRGEPLRNKLMRGPMAPAEVGDQALALARALAVLHEAAVAHRDVKPENVFITEAGTLKLLDLGLAKPLLGLTTGSATLATAEGTIVGTVGYMSPEQVRARPLDARTDVFSFGAVVYEMCTGRPAFAGPSAIETMHAILFSRPERLRNVGALGRVIERCLEKDPEQRYGNAAEVVEALLSVGTDDDGSAQESSLDLTPPVTRYARSGEVHIAYQVVGEAAPDLLFVPGFVSQVEHWWEEPEGAHFFRSLARMGRLILMDKRGTGLSDRVHNDKLSSLEERMSDLGALLDTVGSKRAVLFGISEGGPLCMEFAARYPERVQGLVLYGTSAVFGESPGMDYLLRCARESWGTGATLNIFAPSATNDPRLLRWSARWERLGASPGAAQTILELLRMVDVRSILPQIEAPTLVLHREGDRAVPASCGTFLGQRIRGAQLELLPGDAHVPMVGDTERLLASVRRFIRELRSEP